MTGKINIGGSQTVIEEDGQLAVYKDTDIEPDNSGGWRSDPNVEPNGSVNLSKVGTDADPIKELHAESGQLGEVLLNQYASADAAPAGSGVGIIGVTDDGHILVEDGQ